ncbi:MAG TPA: SDR family NAD(P)-dependent oxidoreductase [Planctomycetota bacterium]|nr:SDR family NAD(P)-dependent oxidoreductase [Planctomycetota bacterium]
MAGPEPKELLGKALVEIRALKARVKELEAARREPIAVVGYGCRFPGAPDPEGFWKLLRDGVDAVREVPRDRFDIDAWYDPDPDQPGRIYTRSAAFLDRVDGFDPGFFSISPREVANLSPQQRLLLEVAWEALEDANLPPARLFGSRTGVFIGQCGFDEGPWNTSGARAPDEIDLYSLTGTTLSITAGRLSYFLGVNGPSLAVDTACSSSLVALQLAVQSLRQGDCERALVGGVHVLTSPAIMLGLCRIKALAPDGRCKSFDARSDGYGRGEGCGVVLLRRLSDALADGDRIHAVIRGVAINQDGASGGLTVPSGPSQAAAIRGALADGAVDPANVAYVEAHGTGTSLGDPIEMRALHAVYDAHTRERPLYVGSVKSNIGHLEAGAGIAGLLKVVLALEHRVIPPSLHFVTPNPHIAWDAIPVEVPTRCVPWPDGPRAPVAGLSSFGLGGTNVHVVLEAAPKAAERATETTLLQMEPVLLLSGRDDAALREAAGRTGRWLDEHPDVALADVCHVAAIGRTHFAERFAFPADDRARLRESLRDAALGSSGAGVLRGRRDEAQPPEIGFAFPASLAAPTAGGDVLARWPAPFRDAIARCAAVLDPLLGTSLVARLGFDGAAPSDAALDLSATLALELALAETWRAFGVAPDFVAGRGIGELAAAADAGVVPWKDALEWSVAFARRGARDDIELSRRIAATSFAPPRCKIRSGATGADVGAEIATPAGWMRVAREITDPAATPRPTSAPRPDDSGSRSFHIHMGSTPTEVAGASAVNGAPGTSERVIPSLQSGAIRCADLLHAVVRAHVRGALVDWNAVEGRARREAATLPTYPFQRESFPIAVAPAPDGATSGAAKSRAPFADWLHEPRWIVAKEEKPQEGAAGRWLVVADRAGFGNELAAALAARGATCVVAPAAELRDGPAIAKRLRELGPAPLRGVVHLGGVAVASGDLSAATLSAGAREACEGVLCLAQELARAALPGSPRLRVVTRGAQGVTGREALEPLQATLWGLGRSCALEAPEIWSGLIDLDPALDAKTSAAALAREVLGAPGDERVALRGSERHVERIARCEATAAAPLALRADATYLVTGGLGGIGLELAERLAARGARKLVLLGRRAPDEKTRTRLAALEAKGCRVAAETCDVADEAALARVLQKIGADAPLRGVFHSAGVVDDVALERQGWDHFEKVLASKLHGGANLHRLTRGLALDHFVLFSSAAALIGSFGQANYAAANAWLDALAQARRAQGLPALSVLWGAWAEVGLARDEAILAGLRSRGFDAMATAPALDALEWAMAQRRPVVAIVPVAWPRFLEQLPPGSPTSLFGEVAIAPAASAGGSNTPPAAPGADAGDAAQRRAELERASRGDRRLLLRRHVAEEVAWILRLPKERAVDEEQGFFQMGMNSLTTVELRRRVGKRLGLTVSATMVFDHPTVRGLAARLEKELFGADAEETPPAPASAAPAPSPGADAEVAGASKDDVNRLLDRELEALGDLLSEPGPAPDRRE